MSNLLEMKEVLCKELAKKTNFEDTELVSAVIFSVISEVFAGDILYIPSEKSSKIHKKLRAKFTGNNHKELARDFGYTVRNVYRILENKSPKQLEIC